MGNLVHLSGDYDEARKLYQQSLEINQELGDKSGIAIAQAQLALLEEKLGNAKEALYLILQAEAIFLKSGSPMAIKAQKDRERLEEKISPILKLNYSINKKKIIRIYESL